MDIHIRTLSVGCCTTVVEYRRSIGCGVQFTETLPETPNAGITANSGWFVVTILVEAVTMSSFYWYHDSLHPGYLCTWRSSPITVLLVVSGPHLSIPETFGKFRTPTVLACVNIPTCSSVEHAKTADKNHMVTCFQLWPPTNQEHSRSSKALFIMVVLLCNIDIAHSMSNISHTLNLHDTNKLTLNQRQTSRGVPTRSSRRAWYCYTTRRRCVSSNQVTRGCLLPVGEGSCSSLSSS